MMRFATRTTMLLAMVCWVSGIGSVGCFRGAEREKEAPPGLPGGLCLAPQPPTAPEPFCKSGQCNTDRNYCFDPADPCDGFFCGGSERGFCMPDSNLQPVCTCEVGFNNDRYDLYCCPDPGTDILDLRCGTSTPSDDGGESGGADDGGGSDGASESSGTSEPG